MLIKPLFRKTMKDGWMIGLILLSINLLYYGTIIYMYNPEMKEVMDQYTAMMGGAMSAMGMKGDTSSLVGFINAYLYGMIMMIVPFIYSLILVNKTIAKPIDTGSLASILATPHSRCSIIGTRLLGGLVDLIVFMLLSMLSGLALSVVMFPGELELSKYIMLNINMTLLQILIYGICFFVGCICNDAKTYMTIGAGIPMVCYITQMAVNMGDKLENLKYFTIFTLYQGDGIVAGKSIVAYLTALIVSSIVLFVVGIHYYCKRDFSL